ncbi:di-heme oxidoredictase family protein [Cereibacter sp. SYSU M97828]|nr:di-heme oxidoredictase family protein [Cereibacter flavus]
MRLLPVFLFCAQPLAAWTASDAHLPATPRTRDEAARIAAVLAPPTDFSAPEAFEHLPAGAATVRRRTTADAFSDPSGNMPFASEMDFKLGNALFRKLWVGSPSSTLASDGLGPLYNARACQSCHVKDGRGHPPEGPQDDRISIFLRLSVPGGTTPKEIADYIATSPDPTYGEQLQDLALPGHAAEGRMDTEWTDLPVTLGDGTVVTLRRPAYSIANPGYGPLAPDVMLSPRVAPQMIGLGLLEAIPAADILAHADEDDADRDGISGRANIVGSVEHGIMLGRFGLKAGQPTIRQQSASAFAGDMGLSTVLFPAPWGECMPEQTACRTAPDGEEPGIREGLEVDAQSLDLVTFYARNLGVPERPDAGDAQVLRGKRMFHEAGCPACHVPKFVTHRLEGRPEQSFQLIWPYTDLLLHDMGEGLADDRPEARATGREWRTPPLWGIGMTETVTGTQSYLHDGRARSLLEAILWHDGEGRAARDKAAHLAAEDRAALLAFLESL